jgi:hypothetical protein
MLNFASIADEALAIEPDCQHEEPENCEHAGHWLALERSLSEWSCEDCRYAWDPSTEHWETTEVCRACGEEDFILWQADL